MTGRLTRRALRALCAAALLCACVGACVCAVCAGGPAQAAPAGMTGSLAVQVPADDELGSSKVVVDAYRVADVDGSYAFAATEAFEGLDVASAPDTADGWQQLAAEAQKMVEDAGGSIAPVATFEAAGAGGASASRDVELGMYLLVPQSVTGADFTFTFEPVLVAVPSTSTGYTHPSSGTAEEPYEVLRDVTATLKMEATPRVGSLEITKTLSSYNATLGPLTCVFQIEAVRGGKVVYSNVASVDFDAAGTKKALVEGIPSGSTVTVTEVYGGASYQVQGSGVQMADVRADQTSSVQFANDYDERLIQGSGIENRFAHNGQKWSWTTSRDAAPDKADQGQVS